MAARIALAFCVASKFAAVLSVRLSATATMSTSAPTAAARSNPVVLTKALRAADMVALADL